MKYCPLCGKEYPDGETCPKDGAVLVLTRPGTELMIGQVLKGSYRIEEQIGQGGMAAVFRGVQLPLERDVAIKVLLPTLQSTPSMIQRFFQEAKLLCQMTHPNVVRIIDFGNTEHGLVYMVMEYLSGTTLREKVPAGGLKAPQAVRLMRQICDGIGAAHRSGLIHRDLKPDNIFVASAPGEHEQVKILDFGIARAVEGEGAQQTRLTQTGLIMGTPGYLAPEQISGGTETDLRSDIYALGAILFFMLTGRRPYDGDTPHAIFIQQLQEPLALDFGLLKDNGGFAEVIRRSMHRDPEQRYQSAFDLVADLERASGGPATSVLPRRSVPTDFEDAATVALASDTAGLEATRPADRPEFPTQGQPQGQAGGRGPWPIVLAAAVLLAVLGGIWWSFGRGQDSGGGTAGGSSTARGVTSERVLVGMSAAFSGSAKELGRGMRTGIEACFQEANEGGGVHGRSLELVALDDGYEPSRTVANMAEMLFEHRVFAFLGSVGTPTAEVAVPLAVEQGAPFVGAFTGADLLRTQPPERLVFNYRASYAEETSALVKFFLDGRGLSPQEIAVFAQEDGFGDAGYRGVVDTLAERGHTERVPRLAYRRNRVEVGPAVETLLRDHPEVRAVIMVATYRAAAELVRRVEDRGGDLMFASLSFVGSRALSEALREMGPGYAEGVIVSQVVPHYDSALPGVVRYRDALAALSSTEQPSFVSLEGYLACRTFVEGLSRAGEDLSVDGFVAAVESMADLDLGIGADLRFGPDRHQATGRVWGTVLDGSGRYQVLDLIPGG
ncbi:MAG: ABC transporter substrate-binding protein [Acidobacteriota bacterium]